MCSVQSHSVHYCERCEQLSVHTTLSSVHTALFSVHTALSSVHTALSSVHTALSSVHTALSSVHTALSSVHTDLSSVHTALSSVHTALSSVPTALSSVHTALPSRPARASGHITQLDRLATAQGVELGERSEDGPGASGGSLYWPMSRLDLLLPILVDRSEAGPLVDIDLSLD